MIPNPMPGSLIDAFSVQKRRNVIVFSVVFALSLVGALVYGLKAGGIIGARGDQASGKTLQASGVQPDGRILTARGQDTAAVFATPGRAQAPVLQQPAAAAPGMPQDVLDYLRHVEKCENFKAQLARKQEAQLMVLLTKAQGLGAGSGLEDIINQEESKNDKSPTEFAKTQSKDLPLDWDSLLVYFRSVRPPRECEKLALNFAHATGEVAGQFRDIMGMLDAGPDGIPNPQDMIAKLNGLKADHKKDIDDRYSVADGEVGAICQRYNTRKWFTVERNPGSGGLLGGMR